MAEWARRIEGEIVQSDRAGETILLFRQPLGVVAGILPWNFPFFRIARKMAPAFITGNSIVIRPSEETPNNAALFARLFTETDLPEGVFNIVYGRGGTTGRAISLHPDVKMVSFTGSVETGPKIMADCAKNITKVNLKLGGKAPAIVVRDADLDLAARCIKQSRVLNTGQVCNAAERVYVDEAIAEEFVEKLSAEMKATRYGDPLGNDELDMGPIINKAGLTKIDDLVQSALNDGAQCVLGGKAADLGQGNHYEPTVLTNCRAARRARHHPAIPDPPWPRPTGRPSLCRARSGVSGLRPGAPHPRPAPAGQGGRGDRRGPLPRGGRLRRRVPFLPL